MPRFAFFYFFEDYASKYQNNRTVPVTCYTRLLQSELASEGAVLEGAASEGACSRRSCFNRSCFYHAKFMPSSKIRIKGRQTVDKNLIIFVLLFEIF